MSLYPTQCSCQVSGVLKSGLRAEYAAGSACEEQDKQGENPFNASNQAGEQPDGDDERNSVE